MKRTISIMLILGILVQSCTTMRQSVVGEKWYQKSDKPVGGHYDFDIIQTPTVNDGNLIIKLKYYGEFPFGKIEIIEKRKYFTTWDYWKTNFLILPFIIYPFAYDGLDHLEGQERINSAILMSILAVLGVGAIISPVILIPLMILDKDDDEIKKKDGIDPSDNLISRKKVEVNVNEITTRKILYPQGSKFKNIYLENNNITKKYTTDYSGKCNINVIKDFNLKQFYKQNENISFTVYDEKRTRIGSFTLQSQNWTLPYIKIRRPIPIYGESKTGEVELGRAKPGDVFPILYEGEDLLKIQYNHQIGWIPKDAGQKFWAVPDYKQ